MSRRPSRSNLTVSLFPFLAVLVCAMGALIFLLIVTTQMIGDETAQKKKKVVETEKPVPAAKPSPFLEVEPYEPPDRETLDAAPEFVVVLPEVEPPPEPKVIVPPPAPLPDPNIELRRQIADLKIQQNRRRQQLAEQAADLHKAERELAAARQDLQQHQAARDSLRAEQTRASDEDEEFQAERRRLLLKIRKTEEHLEELEKRRATVPSKYALVPYDGRQGTTRRPIFVECTEKGIRFLPENVLLGPSQLEGFTDDYNPLLVGVQALNDYWNRLAREPNSQNTEEPYVLLIVRPQGSVTYYMARKFLSEWKDSYGYELIEEDFDWEVPDADPQAQQVLRQAIAEALKNRTDVIRKYTVRGSMDALSEFPDQDDLTDEELPFAQGTSNASRFAAKARQHRRRVAEQGTATGNQGRGPGGQDRHPSLPEWDNVPPQTGRSGSLNPSRQGTAANDIPSGNPSETIGSAGDIPRRFLSPADARALEPGWSRGAANEEQKPSSAGPFGNEPFSTGHENGTSPLFDDSETQHAETGNPLDKSLSDNNAKRTEAGERGGRQGRTNEPSIAANPGDAVLSPSEEKTSQGRSGPQAHPTGNELSNAPFVGRTTAKPGPSSQDPSQSSPQSGGTSSQSAVGAQDQQTLPSLSFDRQEKMDQMKKNLSKRGWGLSRRSGIGIERSVSVIITPDRIQVGNLETAIVLGHGETEQQVVRAVIVDIDENAKEWGTPPSGFYWVPLVRFHVHPTAVGVSKPIERALHDGGLSTKTSYLEADAGVGVKQEATR